MSIECNTLNDGYQLQFIPSLFGTQHERDRVKKKPASLLHVVWKRSHILYEIPSLLDRPLVKVGK